MRRIATRNEYTAEWCSAGNIYSIGPDSLWFAELPEEEWPDNDPQFEKDMKRDWEYGDRRQEIVIIGVKMNESDVKKTLDSCLLTDEEFQQGPEAWKSFEDKWGDWDLEEHQHDDDSETNDDDFDSEDNVERMMEQDNEPVRIDTEEAPLGDQPRKRKNSKPASWNSDKLPKQVVAST